MGWTSSQTPGGSFRHVELDSSDAVVSAAGDLCSTFDVLGDGELRVSCNLTGADTTVSVRHQPLDANGVLTGSERTFVLGASTDGEHERFFFCCRAGHRYHLITSAEVTRKLLYVDEINQ